MAPKRAHEYSLIAGPSTEAPNSLKDAQVQCEESPSTNPQVLAREARDLLGYSLGMEAGESHLRLCTLHFRTPVSLEELFYICLVSWVCGLQGIPLECLFGSGEYGTYIPGSVEL